jgi:transposase, IS5 family
MQVFDLFPSQTLQIFAMKPRTPEVTPQDDLFRSRLENLIAPRHPLVLLAQRIDWEGLNREFGSFYDDAVVGQPPKATRLMAGLLYLKHAYSLSDEALVERWVENRYWQAFCGMEYFQHEPPIHPSSLSRYRTRLGPTGCEDAAPDDRGWHGRRGDPETGPDRSAGGHHGDGEGDHLSDRQQALPAEPVATEPGRTAIGHRTAAELHPHGQADGRADRALCPCQTIPAHASGVEKAQGPIGARGARPGAQDRFMGRGSGGADAGTGAGAPSSHPARTGSNKLYSLHAPEVECISKGKAHKRYEFGVKVGVVACLKKPFILAAHALPGRPYDGHTLMRSLAHATLNTGVKIKTAVADKGYRGHETWPGARIVLPGQRSGTPENAAGGAPGCAGAA